jgi:acetyl esterase
MSPSESAFEKDVFSLSDTRHLVDPELLPVLETFPEFNFSAQNLLELREGLRSLFSDHIELPVTAVEHVIEGPGGSLDVFWYDPAPGQTGRPALLHIHGGGMITGSAREWSHLPSTLAASLGVPVASVEYRLAPETPFPGPQEDCFAALVWMVQAAEELGIDAQRIAVTGESAGGGLAAAVAQMARDRGGPSLAAQILVYPMLDHRVGGEADPWQNRYTGEFGWRRDSNRFGWESLRGSYRPDDARKGWFSPPLADELAGLPPAWIGVGTLDLFFDEDLDYARRLVGAGVPVELHTYAGAFHGFDLVGDTRAAKALAHDRLSGTRRLLGLAEIPPPIA